MAVRRAAVLGSPIEHSKSPLLHQAAYRELGLDWEYARYEVHEGELEGFVGSLDSSWVGLSLTMPLKEEALELADSASDLATKTRAANTVIFRDGQTFADNTDVAGLVFAIESVTDVSPVGRSEARSVTAEPAIVTILGSGATARSAVAAVSLWAPKARLLIAGRTESKVGDLIQSAREDFAMSAVACDLTDQDHKFLDVDVVVNTIPGQGSDAFVELVPAVPGALVDVVYGSQETPLQQTWRARGGAAVDGTTMLVGQAAEQVVLMTGRNGIQAELQQAMFAALELA